MKGKLSNKEILVKVDALQKPFLWVFLSILLIIRTWNSQLGEPYNNNKCRSAILT